MDVDADAEKDDEPLKPLFDDNTGLYFCTDCLAEIEEGFCVLCGDKYEWQEVSIFSMYLQWPRNKAYLNRKTLCGTQRARKIRPFTTIVVQYLEEIHLSYQIACSSAIHPLRNTDPAKANTRNSSGAVQRELCARLSILNFPSKVVYTHGRTHNCSKNLPVPQ